MSAIGGHHARRRGKTTDDWILFLRGRMTFYTPQGTPSAAGHNSGGPSILIAYGPDNARSLSECGLEGKVVLLDPAS